MEIWIWRKDGQSQGQGSYSNSRRGLRPIIVNADISCFFDIAQMIQGFDVIAGRSSRLGEDVGHLGWYGSFIWSQRKPLGILSGRSRMRILTRALQIWRGLLRGGPDFKHKRSKRSMDDRNAGADDCHVGFYDAPLYYDHTIIYNKS